MNHKILVIEDEDILRDVLQFLLSNEGFDVETCKDGNNAIHLLSNNSYDIAICDIKLPGKNGMEILEFKVDANINTSFIMITAYGSVESAVDAIKNGAEEYITKPFINEDLIRIVQKIIEYRQLKHEHALYKKEMGIKYDLKHAIIGKSEPMKKIFNLIKKVSKYDSPILITGESGTGKELIARSIHFNSHRNRSSFVPVNCGAIPESLMESEFFGHVKGAFTGAIKDKKGFFEQAEGGTLFLDEIGEMHLNLQVKLLRVLQENTIQNIGSEKSKKIDVRIIAATNKNIEEAIHEGNFREDLFYRLNVVEINIPPLTERKEDISLLIDYFIQYYNELFGKNINGIEDNALRALLNYSWPGNVREMQHLIQRAIILCTGEKISLHDLNNQKLNENHHSYSISVPDNSYDLKNILDQYKESIEMQLIARALKKSENNRTHAAKLLGISHRSLLYKINKYNL